MPRACVNITPTYVRACFLLCKKDRVCMRSDMVCCRSKDAVKWFGMRRFRLSSGKSDIARVFIFKQYKQYLQKTSVTRYFFLLLLYKIHMRVLHARIINYSIYQFNSAYQMIERKGGGANVYRNICNDNYMAK